MATALGLSPTQTEVEVRGGAADGLSVGHRAQPARVERRETEVTQRARSGDGRVRHPAPLLPCGAVCGDRVQVVALRLQVAPLYLVQDPPRCTAIAELDATSRVDHSMHVV